MTFCDNRYLREEAGRLDDMAGQGIPDIAEGGCAGNHFYPLRAE